ncbi:PHD finger-like domain-containing protein [Drosera capensis]
MTRPKPTQRLIIILLFFKPNTQSTPIVSHPPPSPEILCRRPPPCSPSPGRCVICGGVGISDAYYCKECTQQEKDRDGCPKIVNLGSAKTDLFYERKKYGFKKR